MRKADLWWVLAGAGGLLAVKFAVIGLCQWNSIFYPGQPADATSMFFYPLMGLIHPSTCDQVTTKITY